MRQKRLLSWLLTLCLLLGMFTVPAYAEGNTTTTTISGDGTADKTGTMTITLVVPKKTPAATDLTYTAPSDLVYSGSNKAATIAAASGVTGLGAITVKYYSDASRTTEATPKNVGTYYVGATVAEGDQYAASAAVLYGDGWAFTITASTPSAPAAPTMASATKNSITLNAVSGCEYSKDGANWQSGTEFAGLNPGTEYTFYQRIKATANTNASAASSASFSTEADTYAMTITLTIQEMTASAENVSVAYDGQPHGITVNVTDPASGSTVKYGTAEGTYDLDASPTQTEVGTLTVYYQVTADNYVTKTGSATVTISKADAAAATVTADNRTYDGTDKPLVTVDNTTLVGGSMQYALGTETEATGDFTATIPSKTDAGTYYVWYKVVSDGNHNDYTATAPVTVTIAKANASVTAPTALNLTYTGQEQALVVAGSTNDGEMQYSLDGVSYSATIPTGTEAKTYSVWYKVVGDSNHNDTAPAKIEVKINPASASPTAPTADTLTYTGKPQALVTGGSVTGGELQYALGTDADTEPALESFTTTVPTGTDAGDYFVWYRIKGDANHNDVAPVCIPVSIAKATIAPTVSITGWTYGETANAPSVDGNTGNGAVTYEYSDKTDGTYSATVPTNAGTWYVRAVVAETDNYQGATTQPLSFAIAKAAITITADDKSSVYGADIAALTWKVSGSYVAGDELGISATTTASKTSSVGPYPITVAWNNNANYTATLVNGQYAITPKAITVTADDKTKIIGEADPELTYAVEGLVKGDEMTGSLTREAGEDVGSYAILQGTLSAGDNYSMRFTGAVLTITAKPVSPVSPGYTVLAMMRPAGKTSLKLSWSKVKGAEGYDVFFKRCGAGDYPLVATVKASAARSYTVKGLKKSTSYKAYVKAWKKVGGEKTYIGSASPTVHAITGGYSKTRTDAKKVTVKSPKVTLAVGKTSAIKASVKGIMPDRTLVTHTKALRYYSSNRSVAAVSSSGVIKARSAGACTIYVIANNGVRASVKVTVADAPTNIAFKKSSYSVKAGNTLKLAGQIKLTPAGATTVYTWSSADTDIATVSAKGVVTAIKKGKTVITVTTANGKKAKATIKVK